MLYLLSLSPYIFLFLQVVSNYVWKPCDDLYKGLNRGHYFKNDSDILTTSNKRRHNSIRKTILVSWLLVVCLLTSKNISPRRKIGFHKCDLWPLKISKNKKFNKPWFIKWYYFNFNYHLLNEFEVFSYFQFFRVHFLLFSLRIQSSGPLNLHVQFGHFTSKQNSLLPRRLLCASS